ncbi:protein CHUP1, chloroplastic [Sesamum alatum]|uniref:Protein CHUP1, chloroplastic n=1 Tax=Sesamum alatum TaxID=300844 RepID=A0AAE1YBV3_9LAMI|nr:protein CHUP1, chloroplastic [Sesamum alatum]
MGLKEKRESPMSPVLLKFGVALAFSLGGIVYTFFRSKRIKPSVSKPALNSPGKGSQVGSRRESGEAADRALQDSSLPKVASQNSISDLSSSGRCNGDRDGFLLPEFSQLVKECNMVTTDDMSRGMNGQSLAPDVASPLENKYAEDEEQIREIRSLRNKVKILEERERYLEVQLLEYYGLKEQQNALMELQNRLRLNNMETKLYNLKIESLQADNRRLQAQVADYAKVVAELEAAKAKIKLLRKKLRSDAEQNREHILSLQERVMKLRDPETKAVEVDQELEMQLKKRKELEEELEEMKRSNDSLNLENSELAQKLEYLQMLATSALDNEEIRALKEENQLLRQQNEELRKEIEQIQADRCTDIEELVYLRWINACLRYEMRNYQPGPGKTTARDLSKTLSPKSEEKAKRLILEYAHREGPEDKGLNISDFDSDRWSTSQASYLTDSGEPDDLPVDNVPGNKMNHSSKTKVLAKLMKLWRGKDNHRHIQTPHSHPERAASVDDVLSRFSSNPHSGISLGIDSEAEGPMNRTIALSEELSRHSFNLQRSHSQGQKSTPGQSSNCSRRTSDDGSLSIFRTFDSINDDGSSPSIQPQQDAQNAAKTELVKYAEALKNSRGKSSFRRRSASFSSF